MLNLTFQLAWLPDTDSQTPYISLIKLKSGRCQTLGLQLDNTCVQNIYECIRIDTSYNVNVLLVLINIKINSLFILPYFH
jgi:hypothetical protein